MAAPDGQAGGGMGRVKDYILQTPPDASARYRFVPLVTRDGRGVVFSVFLLLIGLARILWSALRGSIALLHVNMGDRGSIARKGALLMLAHWCGVRTVLHLHAAELEQFYTSASPLARYFIRAPFRAADCVVVLGERYRSWLVTVLAIPAGRVRILNNGVAAQDVVRTPVAPDEPQTILFLGNLIERKGVSDILWALGTLPDDAPRWQGILAGGGDIEGYRALATKIGISDKVEFPGWVDREGAIRLISQASALVLPSYDEGLPLVILEAMGMGLPVICTPVGVIPEVLADGETVLFVEPGDRAALAARIALLLKDADLRSGLSERALTLFDRKFSLNAFQTALLAIYRECCDVDYVPAPDGAAVRLP